MQDLHNPTIEILHWIWLMSMLGFYYLSFFFFFALSPLLSVVLITDIATHLD